MFTQNLKQSHSQRELAKKAQGKSVVHIHNKEIQDLIIPFPCIEEQKNISKYFFQVRPPHHSSPATISKIISIMAVAKLQQPFA